jgi:SAM-dependent methyltransferase
MHRICVLAVMAAALAFPRLVQAQAPVQAEAPKAKAKPTRAPDIVYVPTPRDVVEKMIELAKVGKDDVVYDLGCGDGRIVITAAKKFGCKAVGFDIDPERVEESRKKVEEAQVGDLVKIEHEDVFTVDLRPASVVTLYLLPKLNVKLIPQLNKLKPGSRVVSHDFDMRGMRPDKVVSMTSQEDGVSHTIYLWTIPLKKEKPADE